MRPRDKFALRSEMCIHLVAFEISQTIVRRFTYRSRESSTSTCVLGCNKQETLGVATSWGNWKWQTNNKVRRSKVRKYDTKSDPWVQRASKLLLGRGKERGKGVSEPRYMESSSWRHLVSHVSLKYDTTVLRRSSNGIREAVKVATSLLPPRDAQTNIYPRHLDRHIQVGEWAEASRDICP